MITPEPDMQPRSRWHDLLPAMVLGMAAFLTQFDVTAVVVAMPVMAAELDFGGAAYAWVMDAYSLAFTGGLLAAGALADKYGRRRALLGGNVVFLVGSIICGFAAGGPMLWAARAIQGLGAAFVITGGIALLASAYARPDERARAFAFMGVLSGIAMALGPTLGEPGSDGAGSSWPIFRFVCSRFSPFRGWSQSRVILTAARWTGAASCFSRLRLELRSRAC
ncbi:MFS family permease [Bradyrhizobium ottawaense]